MSNSLNTLAGFLDDNLGVGVVYSDGVCFDSEAGQDLRLLSSDRPPRPSGSWLETFVRVSIIGPPHCAMVRRAALDSIGYPYFDEQLHAAEDVDLWIRLAANDWEFAETNAVTCRYRIHKNNTYSITSPGYGKAVSSYLAQRRKVFDADYFPSLSYEIQRGFLYDWLTYRTRDPFYQEDVLASPRFHQLDPLLRADILFRVAIENIIDGYSEHGRSRLKVATSLQPLGTKVQIAALLASLGGPFLSNAVGVRRKLVAVAARNRQRERESLEVFPCV